MQQSINVTGFSFDNTYIRDLPGFYAPWQPEPVAAPALLYLNSVLADDLCLDLGSYDSSGLADLFSGKRLPEGAEPIAQAYAGHQFGHFNPELGDGRALIIGEVNDSQGRRFDIAFKGSGRTPFSRSGDGKAAIGPMLREVLIAEAMHALGVPTTRSLAVVGTGETVYRDEELPGAVLTRVAASHIRVGTFEFFAARDEYDKVKRLADYTIARHVPELIETENRYLAFLRAVILQQADLVAQWMSFGFIHGVMNTDNMSIAGETIDYGPCAFMEAYDPVAVFSSIDRHGRYAYQNQPRIAQWNLTRFAETLLFLFADDESQAVELATQEINEFPRLYQQQWLQRMRAKLGLSDISVEKDESDLALIEGWLNLLHEQKVDFTLAWRYLADAVERKYSELQMLFREQAPLESWLLQWHARCAEEQNVQMQVRAEAMRKVNPWLIPRNHLVEKALAAASDDNNLKPFERLLAALQQPYTENPHFSGFAEPAPGSFTASYQTFCGT